MHDIVIVYPYAFTYEDVDGLRKGFSSTPEGRLIYELMNRGIITTLQCARQLMAANARYVILQSGGFND
jgi:hypothetical protein